MSEERSRTQAVTDRARGILREGNTRYVRVDKGIHRAIDLPLTLVVIAAVLAPWVPALGIVLALVLGYRISIERRLEQDEPDEPVGDEAT